MLALGCLTVTLLALPSRARAQSDDALAKRGKTVWTNRGCGACHGIGKKMVGPDLAGVDKRRSRDWLNRWFKDTDQMLASDPAAQALLKEFNGVRMPKQNLTQQDVDAILAYVQSESAKLKK